MFHVLGFINACVDLLFAREIYCPIMSNTSHVKHAWWLVMYVVFYFASRHEICKQLESKLEININSVPVNNRFEYLCIAGEINTNNCQDRNRTL